MKSLFWAAAAALMAGGAALAQPEVSTVTVNVGTVVRPFDDRLAGINVATWDNAPLLDSASLAVALATDVRLMRFPGGSTADTYHWATNSSDPTPNYHGVSFDQFETVLAASNHIQSIITTNYGSGTAQEAGAWVADALAKGYNVKYWEIGNECYGGWENDTHTLPHDPLTYALQAIQYISAMKQADPTARVGVVLALGEDNYANYPSEAVKNPVTGAYHSGWDAVVLSTLAQNQVTPDFVIYHSYPENTGQESDTGLMQAGSQWLTAAATLQSELNDYLGAAAASVEMLNTENNSVSSNPGKQSTSLVDGLYMADSFGYICQSRFDAWVWWALYNSQDTVFNNSPSLYGWREYGDYGIVEVTGAEPNGLFYFPTYYVAKILSHFARAGDAVVAAQSSLSSLLDVFAARRTDGSLSLLVVNKSIPTAGNPSGVSVTANFALSGFTPAANAAEYQYGVPQDSRAETDTNGSVDPISDPLADVQVGTVGIGGASFSLTFPAASVTLLSLPPAQGASANSRLVNISSNGYVEGTTHLLDAGFIIAGSGSEQVLVRGVGPALAGYGVSSPVSNVQLQIFDAGGNVLYANNGWSGGTATNTSALQAAFSSTGAFPLPVGSLDSALLVSLPPGSYTAEVSGMNGAAGTGLAEVYEVSTSGTRLHNISCRGYVDNAGHALTDGFYISASGPEQEQVLIRGVGPTLANFGLTSFAADPTLKLIPAGTTNVISADDDWSDSTASGLSSAFALTGAFALPPLSRDAAVEIVLPGGGYTAQVTGTNGPAGDALVEIYEVPQG
ncbi:MAG TPA: hypothetical protein VFE31_12960 [Opitutaceae bacterium]|nr:hypothetical protein [Opitutaceae bacterium]